MKHTWWKFQLIIQIRNMFHGMAQCHLLLMSIRKNIDYGTYFMCKLSKLNGYDEIHSGQHPAFLHNLNGVNPSHHSVHVEYFSCVQCSDKSGLLSVMFDIHIDGCDCFFLRISADVMVANWYSTLF